MTYLSNKVEIAFSAESDDNIPLSEDGSHKSYNDACRSHSFIVVAPSYMI